MLMNGGMTGFFGPNTRDIQAPMCGRHGQRRHIAGVPMILMTGMKDMPRSPVYAANQGRAIHYLGDVLESLVSLMLSTFVSIAGKV